jgi:hypothetical protein
VPTQSTRDLRELARRDSIDAPLIFVRLLVSDSDELRELLLGEAEYCPAFAHARANVAVERLHTTPTGTGASN